MTETMANHPRFPMPGEEFDDGIVVASGWLSDHCDTDGCWCGGESIGVLLVHPDRPGEFYSIGEYRNAGSSWEQTWSEVGHNIVPTARRFDEQFGFWGEA